MQREQFKEIFSSIADLLKILAHPDRLKILGLILRNEMDVNKLHSTIGISQSRVSQHLKLLKYHSLVAERREGKHVFYSLKDPSVSKIVEGAIEYYILKNTTDLNKKHLVNELINLWK